MLSLWGLLLPVLSLGLEETLEDSEVLGDLEDAGAVNLALKDSGRRSHLIDLIAFRAGMMGSLVPNAGLRRGLTLRVEPWPGEAKPD